MPLFIKEQKEIKERDMVALQCCIENLTMLLIENKVPHEKWEDFYKTSFELSNHLKVNEEPVEFYLHNGYTMFYTDGSINVGFRDVYHERF